MKKFSCMMMGAAALAAFTACSSDDVKPVNPDQGNGEGTTMYLSINIKDANSRSRAIQTEDDAPFQEGDLVWGNTDEHTVTRADFFFFDEKGVFVANTNEVYNFTDGDTENIEWMGKNKLVLRGLDEENLPKYMITVLNAPVDLATKVRTEALSMDATRQLTQDILNGNNFIMSTTSFLDAADQERYDNVHYYATKLKTSDFTKEIADATTATMVDVYVERLAAKFELTGLSADYTYPVKVTVGGEENNNGGVELQIVFKGFGISGQETESYLSKNLDSYASSSLWTDWNMPGQFRSHWGKSVEYGKALESAMLQHTTYNDAVAQSTNAGKITPIYGYETTTALANLYNGTNLVNERTPHFIIVAQLQTTDGTPYELVEYRGTYYTFDEFYKVSMQRAQANGYELYSMKEVPTGGTGSNGEALMDKVYTGVPFEAYTFAMAEDTAEKNGAADVTVVGLNLTVDGTDVTTFYKVIGKDTNNKNIYEALTIEEAVAYANTELAALSGEFSIDGFKDGMMFYSIPVEHLLGPKPDGTNSGIVASETEGVYGVVRNHWYQLAINSVKGLGKGIFNPGKDIVPVTPDPDHFALGADINILSWKIVQQSVDL